MIVTQGPVRLAAPVSTGLVPMGPVSMGPVPGMAETPPERAEIAALRARVRRLEHGVLEHGALEPGPRDAGADGPRVLPLGPRALDDHLPGGGLPLARLHEIEGERREWDDGPATGFCAALLARLLASGLVDSGLVASGLAGGGPVLWVTRWRDLHAPGLLDLGLDPGRLILVRAGAEAEVLWAMEEGLRCSRIAAVVGEVDSLPRGAGRRLQLAAEAGGVTAFLLRRRLRPARRAGEPSAATTRWRIAPVCVSGDAPAGPLPARRPRWRTELLRCRGAAPGRWILEWDDASGDFALAAPLRDRPLAPAAGAPAAGLRYAGAAAQRWAAN